MPLRASETFYETRSGHSACGSSPPILRMASLRHSGRLKAAFGVGEIGIGPLDPLMGRRRALQVVFQTMGLADPVLRSRSAWRRAAHGFRRWRGRSVFRIRPREWLLPSYGTWSRRDGSPRRGRSRPCGRSSKACRMCPAREFGSEVTMRRLA